MVFHFVSLQKVPGTSPEGPLNALTSGTCSGPSEESQWTNTKIDDLMVK